MITTFEFGTPAYDESIRLRDDILRKPLNMVFYAEDLAKEFNQIHIGYYNENGVMTGCMVLQDYGEGQAKMRQVAVAKNQQGKGIGKKMVNFFEQYARQNGFKKVVLHAREVACPFYDKLGYDKVGERFEEVNVPHFKMEKKL
ncbi:MAG: GNAT family N-acetyltransferase [Saprospiraceae bacterium]